MAKKSKSALSLDERALLVKLSIGVWSASKTDKEVTVEVTESKKAKATAGKFRKSLIDREKLSKINKIAGAARATHYALTLPWDDDGSRIITTEQYEHYSRTMRDFRIAMQEAVDEFCKRYKKYIKESEEYLGELFKVDDYPTVEEVRSKFSFDVEPRTIPMQRDFRAKVSNKEAEIITKDIEQRNKARLEAAMNDVWKRIAEATEKMAIKLKEYQPKDLAAGHIEADNVFRDSLIENVKSLSDMLPGLNINNDPKLDAIHADIEKRLTKWSAQDLRTDDNLRHKTAAQAQKIFDKVSAYMQ